MPTKQDSFAGNDKPGTVEKSNQDQRAIFECLSKIKYKSVTEPSEVVIFKNSPAAEYTHGPVCVEAGLVKFWLHAPNGRIVCSVDDDKQGARDIERLRACYNACENIEDPGTTVPELLEALKSLGRKYDDELCFCEVAIGNPMARDHSEACKRARAVITKAEGRAE